MLPLSSTFTERVGRITASDQTVRAVHSCISWFHLLIVSLLLLGCMDTSSCFTAIFYKGEQLRVTPCLLPLVLICFLKD